MSIAGRLSGWRVLVTRPVEQAQDLAEALATAGATPIIYPAIALAAPDSWDAFDEAVQRIGSYTWLVVTSPSAVRFALGRAPELARRLSSTTTPRVAAVGRQTARALEERGISAALVPDDQRQEGLTAAFAALAPGTRLLFPQAAGGRELLRDVLTARGCTVDVVPVYRTVPATLTAPPPPFDAVMFASPSAVRAFATSPFRSTLNDRIICVIGPTTETAARSLGLPVHAVAAAPSVTALVEAAVQALANRVRPLR